MGLRKSFGTGLVHFFVLVTHTAFEEVPRDPTVITMDVCSGCKAVQTCSVTQNNADECEM